jgi:transposase
MRQKSGKLIDSAEKVIKDIRRETRKRYSSEEKTRVVLEGLAVSPPELRLPLPI